jgi:alpha-ribazole phosphatase
LIYVIRHAEPTLTGVFLGSTDAPLSETGRTQALALSEKFAPHQLKLTNVYVSPLQRAQQTAEGILAPKTTISELAECHFGDWEGKNWQQIEQIWPDLAAEKMIRWKEIPPPNGEPFVAFANRVEKAWQRILKGPRPVAVVAHLGVNAVIASLVEGTDPMTYQQAYATVREYDF